jgi:hypothetical protein
MEEKIVNNPQKSVAEHLKNGNSLTVMECWQLYHTTELRRIISRLKREGMQITGAWEKGPQNAKYKRYKAA